MSVVRTSTGGAKVKSTSTEWSGEWEEQAFVSGPGVVIEGNVTQVRYHSVSDARDVHRYMAVRIKVTMARKRNIDEHGIEHEPRMVGMKRLRTGYLSYKKVDPKDPDAVLPDELSKLLGSEEAGTSMPPEVYPPALEHVHPTVEGVFELWGESDMMRPLDLRPEDELRIRTKGNSMFIESIARTTDSSFQNYSGGQVLDGWASKIKPGGFGDNEPLPGEDKEGIDSDEWDNDDDSDW
ncbi:uncharacterized protein AMSG_01810 [Thecamonas trahens ATCC 50062]|uniref:Arpin n=1 Tax=Thecamonas trahens ATCC 50062 TaxID=461836 RepID=A0A0L0DTJ5_THETB|nr:hypothetical protein AMSG_01810 [Thecamonas trahens ATCC 50062]KNC55547.1 hypothetical protein AMSG_01810 [Thecamonas trahens ATCC 50062]|eukprot:XP_013761321.1 hypothetical protein AMSG_01810 [Thecamonas trahens ATCC 50062]